MAAGVAVILPRHLGLIGNVYARERYSYMWVDTRGTGWVAVRPVLLLVAVPVIAAGIRSALEPVPREHGAVAT